MNNPALFHESHCATYCPEDDKLRLYIGRVPNDEYKALRAEGWVSTPKQSENGQGEFAAVWTVSRKETAESYAGVITDEDAGPEERAADRAERFTGYLGKRLGEATGHADRYDSGPSAHGFQSKARAVRAADRHDRIATRAVDAWEKAEYWQRRTAGVISSALYKSSPGVRMGRIKTIEAELRKAIKTQEEYAERFRRIEKIAADPDGAVAAIARRCYEGDLQEAARSIASEIAGHGKHRNPCDPTAPEAYDFEHQRGDHPPTVADYAAHYLRTHHAPDTEGFHETRISQFIRHCELRLAYEHQMLEAQGGRAAMVEMEVGGFIGGRQIRKVNKSPATGRVVSVQVMGRFPKYDRAAGKETMVDRLAQINIERLAVDSYRPPTPEEKAALAATIKAEKAANPAPKAPPLINPTLEDARRLQTLINEQHAAEWQRHHGTPTKHYFPKAPEVQEITQAIYSANSSGSYAKAETRGLCADGQLEESFSNMWSSSAAAHAKSRGPALCKIRITGYDPVQVLVITDKPQKPLPSGVWSPIAAEPAPAPVEPSKIITHQFTPEPEHSPTPENAFAGF